jgi:ferredoxin-type protein NapG
MKEDLERRGFFKLGLKKAAKAVVDAADTQVQSQALHWIRPPFAVRELDFLLACTRCDKCIEVCEPKVLFNLSPRLGAQVVNTPAMDLLNKGCTMCDGWPCVAVCEPEALKLPMQQESVSGKPEDATPKLALISIDEKTCLPFLGPECGACKSACPIPAALVMEGGRLPRIDHDHCTGCALCRLACIIEPKAVNVSPIRLEVPQQL